MKRTITILAGCLLTGFITWADIAPNPIKGNAIYTADSCKIRMVSETVIGDLYNDSSIVECNFEMLNYGDSITIEIGFPVMNFQYWSSGEYEIDDKNYFKVYVDNVILTKTQIEVPHEMKDIYNEYLAVFNKRKIYEFQYDSICKANQIKFNKKGEPILNNYNDPNNIKDLAIYSFMKENNYGYFDISKNTRAQFESHMEKGNFPWYTWKVHFESNETKHIKVIYNLPAGFENGYHDKYFNYVLRTGAGWYRDIEKADVILNLHGIKTRNIKQVRPIGSIIDNTKKTITWNFRNLEPTANDDIYVIYSNPRKKNSKEIQRLKRELRK